MGRTAAITIYRPREEVQRLFEGSAHRFASLQAADGAVVFHDAPGDRGTEIRVSVGDVRGGPLAEALRKLSGSEPYAAVKDDLRRFKQQVETGEIVRSDAQPEGERVDRKLRQRPAQPLPHAERATAGLR